MARILFCDDNQAWRETMKGYLSYYGFEIHAVEQSSDVLEQLTRDAYDLVICNAWQGSLIGLILSESIRNCGVESVRKIPILVIAPEPLDHEDYKMMRESRVYFMTKYKGPEKWYEKINMILSR